MTIERIDNTSFEKLLPLLSWRLNNQEPDSFSLKDFKAAICKQYSVSEHHEDAVQLSLRNGYLLIFACVMEGRYVGYISCFKQPKPNFLLCYNVDELWVAPKYRRMGIAKALLHSVAVDARKNGAVQTRLYVGKGNKAARKLYLSCGYTEASEAVFCTHAIED
ncbi:MAG: GNAT family N-acetyltransferase [Spirochaetales bacterium]|jgi:ribosomal protein S18 acetylase RimI-like enzyme|nr:GNAT family N-acetyltransferase [Spirochaetales bacterium]